MAGLSAAARPQTADGTDGVAGPQNDKFSELIATRASTAEAPVTREDISAMRQEGWGWGAIANFFGFKLGHVVSDANREKRDDRLAEVKGRSAVADAAGPVARGGEDGAGRSGRSGADGGQRGGGRGGEGGGRGGGGQGGGRR